MDRVHDSIAWYQKQIGSYDKQLWEQSVEKKLLKAQANVHHAPRKSVRVKTEFIDVDLIRGSTFSKTKPQAPWTYITRKAIIRVFLLPFCYRWWIQQTSVFFFTILLFLYLSQVTSIFIYYSNIGDSIVQDELTASEVFFPIIITLILGLIHSQTVLSHYSHKPPSRDSKLRHISKTKRRMKETEIHTRNNPSEDTAQSTQLDNSALNKGNNSNTLPSGPSEHSANTSSQLVVEPPPHGTPFSLRVNNSKRAEESSNRSVGGNSSDNRMGVVSPSHDVSRGQWQSVFEANDGIRRSDGELRRRFVQEKVSADEKNIRVISSFRHSKCRKSDLEEYEVDVNSAIFPAELNQELKSKLLLGNGSRLPNGGNFDEISDNVPSNVSDIRNPNRQFPEERVPEGVSSESLRIEKVVKKFNDNVPSNVSDIRNPNSRFPEERIPEGVSSESLLIENVVKKLKVVRSDLYGRHGKIEVEESESAKCSREDPNTLNGDKFQNEQLLDLDGSPTNENLPPDESSNRTETLDKNSDRASLSERLDVEDFRNLCNRARAVVGAAKVRRRYCSLQTPEDLGEVSDCECLPEDLEESAENWRRKRKLSSTRSADLGEISRARIVPNKLTFLSEQILKQERNSSENDPANSTPEDGSRVGMSGVEWDDRIQSDLTTSSSYSTSCDSANELSDGESLDQQEILDIQHSWPSSSLNVINLLQPPTLSNIGVSHIAPPDKVSCVIWEGNECKKVDLTALDIGWAIIDKVDNMSESSDYIWIGIGFSLMIGCVPLAFRAYHAKELPSMLSYNFIVKVLEIIYPSWRRNMIMLNGIMQRLCLSLIFFFLLSVADRTFKQRLLYAKHFCYLTSSRRARKFDMPHFRLNKVRNIKTWLSLRSYLKRRGPQRSVDVIVSATFLTAVCLVSLMCLQMLKDSDTYLDYLCNWELIIWCLCLGVYLLRFMTLGLKINKKYRNLSVLITEQINLYLQMEQKPHKKEELILANNVLKLAEDLLKELESPFKISGFSANPFIYNMTKVVVLSAFSTVLTELLGFKLKLYKIKFKA